MLTQNRLKNVLSYDEKTGIFLWKEPNPQSRQIVGTVAGCSTSHGYWRIMVDNVRYGAHRLAWLYVYGQFPAKHIDHINGNRMDNRICNLREATPLQNSINRKTSKEKLRGVFKVKDKYRALIGINGVQTHLGYFDCPAAASLFYQIAADKHFGEFARIS